MVWEAGRVCEMRALWRHRLRVPKAWESQELGLDCHLCEEVYSVSETTARFDLYPESVRWMAFYPPWGIVVDSEGVLRVHPGSTFGYLWYVVLVVPYYSSAATERGKRKINMKLGDGG
jgi:hypothetical protein